MNSRIESEIEDHSKNSSALTKEIISEICRRCHEEVYVFNNNDFKINFRNRVYDAVSHSLEKHNINYRFNYTLNAELSTDNANLKHTHFLSFITTLCGHDKDKMKRLQEACGILISDIPFKGAIFFIGEHDTGKSTLTRVLKYLVGDKYVSSVPLDKMDKNFALSQMRNARLNIAGEIAHGVKPQQFKIFKELTGGDSTYIDVKFEQPYSTVITAKHLFSGNFLPELPIEDDSLIDRLNVIYFSNTIPRDNRDINLTEKLIKEIDKIAIWCVTGLNRYIKNRYKFTEDADSTNYYTRHLRQCNSGRAFVDEFLTSGENDDYVVNTELFDLYCCFCSDNDLPLLSKQQLFKEVKNKYPNSSRGRVYIGNERPQATYGIKFIES